MTEYHLAQLNIARALAPMDDPKMADFVARLDEINRLADGSPGFVWRLQDESGDATAIRAFDDPNLLVNMSVWESPDALFDYVYRSGHARVMARRRDWFDMPADAHTVLWWIPAGHIPSLEEAKARLDLLRAEGPGPRAFTFKNRFPPPDASDDEAA